MINIVFVIADLGMGGAQRVISLLATRLSAQADTRVDIVSMGADAGNGFFSIPPDVKIHSVGAAGRSQGAWSAIQANVQRVVRLRAVLRGLAPDVVISFQTETNCTTLLAMTGVGVPIIISERSDPYVHPQAPVWRVIRRLVYPLAQVVVLQTAHAARFFQGFVKNSVVIFNPVAVDADMSAAAPIGPYILGVGRLSAEKGFDVLIAAHALALKNCPDLKLVLVGDGPQKQALRAQVDILGTADHVVFAGSQDKLAGYYRAATMFVLPSQFEGLPNALLEAMAYGVAVISTPLFAAAPEIITHGYDGLIAEDGGAQAVAVQITHIYENDAVAHELRKNAVVSAQRFEGGTICAAWLRLIESVT